MMCREQKTEQGELDFDCPLGDREEPEVTKEARNIETPETTAVGSVELLGKVLSIDNMFDACERVVRNGGTAGVDGMTVEELQPYLIKHYRELCESIQGGWYKPAPVRRVEIPKPDGGKRQLGIPTVIDRAARLPQRVGTVPRASAAA